MSKKSKGRVYNDDGSFVSSSYMRKRYGKAKKKKSNSHDNGRRNPQYNEEKYQDSNVVEFNKDFMEGVPQYYLDSGIVITFAQVDRMIEQSNFELEDVKRVIMAGNRNIDSATADELLRIFVANREGKAALCVAPTVYKETVMDGNFPVTQAYVRNNCFLVLPKEDLRLFAEKTAAIQRVLKSAQVGNFGLKKEGKRTRSGKYIEDDNLEDRLNIAEVIVLAEEGKDNVKIVSCSSRIDDLRKIVQDIYNESLNNNYDSSRSKPFVQSENAEDTVFLQINGKDMGNYTPLKDKGIGRKDLEERHKLSVILNGMIKEICRSEHVQVLTPADLAIGANPTDDKDLELE